MFLAVDVGNTQTTIGVFEGKTLKYRWRINTEKRDTSDELRLKAFALIEPSHIEFKDIDDIVIASVVPKLTESWDLAAQDIFGKPALVCNAETAAAIFPVDYPNPHEIGADRVADAIAAKASFGAPVVVIDFGTATNIEVIDKQGFFKGGIIAPGMETSANALFSHATKLSAIDLVDPHVAIGSNTEEAVQIGIVHGEALRADGLLNQVFEWLGYEAPVVATGGLCERVAALSRRITHVNKDLTLEGLRLFHESVVAKQS